MPPAFTPPAFPPQPALFASSLVESSSLLRTHSRWPALLSLAAQAAVASVLVALPLLHPDILPLRAPRLSVLAPPPRPPQPPPPPPRVLHVETTSTTAPATPSAPTQPARLETHWTSTNTPIDAPPLAIGLNLGPARPNLPSALIGSGLASPTINVATTPAGTHTGKPLSISSGVIAGLLIAPITPIYPPIARISRTQGTVIVQAIISRTGHIESAHVLSGPIMLQAAALQAIRDARYRPFLLNNEPTEVETTISIHFTLGG